MDSSGLHVLEELNRVVAAAGGAVEIRCSSPHIQKVLSVLRGIGTTSAPPADSHWLALAGHARDRARRANTRAAATPFAHVAERFEQEAAFNFALARMWSEFAAREHALANARLR